MVLVWGWGTLALRHLFRDSLLLADVAFCVICNVNSSLLSTKHHQGGLLPLALPPSHLSQLLLFTRDPPGVEGASWWHFVSSGNTASSLHHLYFSFYFFPCGFCSVSAAFVSLYMNFKAHRLHFSPKLTENGISVLFW